MTILVFGSVNMDLVTRTPRLPNVGETLTGSTFETIPGGKGANQAIAAARLGVPVQMVGRVGNDAFGQRLLDRLKADGVDCDGVGVDASTHSGVAAIAVAETGENHITVIPGANGQVSETDLDRLQEILPQATHLLLQLEVPLNAVVAAAKAAKQANVAVILDPAPARLDLPPDLYPLIDILTPNQVEASQLVGFAVEDWATAEQAAIALQQRGTATVIVKLGSQGALCRTLDSTFQIPAFSVHVVDTVAAGDAFNGGLAAALASGADLLNAAIQASAVAALSVTKAGAQPSLPTQAELLKFLSSQN